MAKKVIMPKQGLQMIEGTITQWLKKEGDMVIEGEPLFEMETDKLTITIDAPANGILLKIVQQEGAVVPITGLIAVIGNDGEDISSLLAESSAPVAAPPSPLDHAASAAAPKAARHAGSGFTSPRARMRAQERSIDINAVPGSGPDGMVIERDVLAYPTQKDEIPTATPLARKEASLSAVDISSIPGTGSHGKVTNSDVLSVVAARIGGAGTRGEQVIPICSMRRVIAERMMKSLLTQAQLTHQISVDMTNASNLREIYKKAGKKVSYNDIVLMAASRALTDYPIMNATFSDQGIVLHNYVNLGVAVALENGLIVPNIKNADLMRLEEIGIASRDLAAKARENRLVPDEYACGTFTVSNLGSYGLDNFVAIINPPESGILALGAVKKTPVAADDELAIRPIMTMTLTYDHRIVDGAPAAAFLARIKQYVETPSLML